MTIAGYNWVAVLVAALAVQPIGALWYSTKGFGKAWMQDTGITPEDAKNSPMKLLFFIGFVGPLVQAVTLVWLVAATGMTTLGAGAALGLVTGIGIACAGMAPHYAFAGKSLRLYLIDSGHLLAGTVVIGAIVGVWQ